MINSIIAYFFVTSIQFYLGVKKDGVAAAVPFTPGAAKVKYSDSFKHYYTQTGLAGCRAAECPNLEMNRKRFKPDGNMLLITSCNDKTYLMNLNRVSARQSWQECCKYGMIPASFTNLSEIKCVTGAFQALSKSRERPDIIGKFINDFQFRTAYADVFLDRRGYMSCYSGQLADNDMFAADDGSTWEQACTTVSLTSSGLLSSWVCDTMYFRSVICESVPDSIKSITPWQENITAKFYTPETVSMLTKLKIPNCAEAYCGPEVSYSDAWSECCAQGGIVVSVDSAEELECLLNQLNPDTGDIVQYWTSLVDWRLEGKIKSCVSMHEVSDEVMWPTFANKTEACTVLAFTSRLQGLINVNCDVKASVLCQLFQDPAELRYSAAAIKKFEQENLLQCRSSYCTTKKRSNMPKDVFTFKWCTKKYHLFPETYKGTLSYAWSTCCKHGLVLASVDSADDVTCVRKHRAKGDLITYTSAMDHEMKSQYISCVSEAPITSEMWASKKDYKFRKNDNLNELCVAVVMRDEDKMKGLHQVACDNQTFRVICEDEPNTDYWKKAKKWRETQIITTTTLPLLTPPFKRYKPIVSNHFVASNIHECKYATCPPPTENDACKKALLADSDFLRCKSNNYFISKREFEASSAWSICCYFGLVPATIISSEAISCITVLAQNLKQPSSVFHTGMVDATLDRRFISCASGEPVPDYAPFRAGEPDNKQSKEACLAVDISGGTPGLADVPCNKKAPILCEVPETLSKHYSSSVFNSLNGIFTTTSTTTPKSCEVSKQTLAVKLTPAPTKSNVTSAQFNTTSVKSNITSVKSNITSVKSNSTTAKSNLVKPIVTTVKSKISTVKPTGTKFAIKNAISSVKPAISSVKSTVKSITSSVKSTNSSIKTPDKTSNSSVKSVISSVKTTVKSATSSTKRYIQT